jgi:hypothetical protein
MYQKDYILFMIEQFARLLRRILNKIAGGHYDDASYEIEQVYRQHLGINSDLINSFHFSALMMLQSADPDTYFDRCVTLGELLRLEGEIFAKNGVATEARGRYHKALGVLLTVFLDEQVGAERYPEQRERIWPILDALRALEPESTKLAVKTPQAEPRDPALPEDVATLFARYRAKAGAQC